MPEVRESDSVAQRTKPRGVTTKRVRSKIKMDPSFRWDDERSEDPSFRWDDGCSEDPSFRWDDETSENPDSAAGRPVLSLSKGWDDEPGALSP